MEGPKQGTPEEIREAQEWMTPMQKLASELRESKLSINGNGTKGNESLKIYSRAQDEYVEVGDKVEVDWDKFDEKMRTEYDRLDRLFAERQRTFDQMTTEQRELLLSFTLSAANKLLEELKEGFETRKIADGWLSNEEHGDSEIRLIEGGKDRKGGFYLPNYGHICYVEVYQNETQTIPLEKYSAGGYEKEMVWYPVSYGFHFYYLTKEHLMEDNYKSLRNIVSVGGVNPDHFMHGMVDVRDLENSGANGLGRFFDYLCNEGFASYPSVDSSVHSAVIRDIVTTNAIETAIMNKLTDN